MSFPFVHSACRRFGSCWPFPLSLFGAPSATFLPVSPLCSPMALLLCAFYAFRLFRLLSFYFYPWPLGLNVLTQPLQFFRRFSFLVLLACLSRCCWLLFLLIPALSLAYQRPSCSSLLFFISLSFVECFPESHDGGATPAIKWRNY